MTYLQILLAEAMGVPADDPKVVAAVKAIKKARAVDEKALLRYQIQHDPCTDCKQLMRKYHVCQSFVYSSWRMRLAEPRGERAELRPKDSRSKTGLSSGL